MGAVLLILPYSAGLLPDRQDSRKRQDGASTRKPRAPDKKNAHAQAPSPNFACQTLSPIPNIHGAAWTPFWEGGQSQVCTRSYYGQGNRVVGRRVVGGQRLLSGSFLIYSLTQSKVLPSKVPD